MLQCPQCGASYDDEVEFCFVDGQALEPTVEQTGPPSIAAPTLPPSKSPPTDVQQPLASRVASSPVAQRSPAASSRGRPAWVVPIAILVGVVVCAGLGVGVAVGGLSGSAALPKAKPVPMPLVPAPVAAAIPAAPSPAVPTVVDLTSEPNGAEVWEGAELMCVTPCKVGHEEGASLPRHFVYKRGGYNDLEVELTELSRPLRGTLVEKSRAAPRPRPRPRPSPSPRPAPADDLWIER